MNDEVTALPELPEGFYRPDELKPFKELTEDVENELMQVPLVTGSQIGVVRLVSDGPYRVLFRCFELDFDILLPGEYPNRTAAMMAAFLKQEWLERTE